MKTEKSADGNGLVFKIVVFYFRPICWTIDFLIRISIYFLLLERSSEVLKSWKFCSSFSWQAGINFQNKIVKNSPPLISFVSFYNFVISISSAGDTSVGRDSTEIFDGSFGLFSQQPRCFHRRRRLYYPAKTNHKLTTATTGSSPTTARHFSPFQKLFKVEIRKFKLWTYIG